MPTTNTKMPSEFPTLKHVYWATGWGQELLEHVLKERQRSWRVAFSDEIVHFCEQYSNSIKHRNWNSSDWKIASDPYAVDYDAKPFAAAFLEKTYPVDKPEQRKISVINWITQRYLNEKHNDKQILAEDLYKIGEDVRYFMRLQDGGHIKGKAIEDHESLADLRETLKPFAEKRAIKRTERLERHVGASAKNEIMAGTTILHDSDLGKIVMVHTIKASQYWGNSTKWCISGSDTAEDFFSGYNKDGPILMILPGGGDKYALVNNAFWDPQDKRTNFPPENISHLLEEFMDTMSAHYAAKIHSLMPSDTPASTLKPFDYEGFSDEEIKWVKDLLVTEEKERDKTYPEAVAANKKIMLAAVIQNRLVLRYADPDLKKDKDFICAAVAQNGKALYYADPELKKDKDVVRIAVTNDGCALSHADPELKKDKDIVCTAVTQNAFAIHYANPGLMKNFAFLKELMEIPSFALNIEEYYKEFPDLPQDEDVVLRYKIEAIKSLVKNGKEDEASNYLRFLKPLWGRADKIFGAPADVIQWLESQRSPDVAFRSVPPEARAA